MATLHYRCTPSEQRLRGKTAGRPITLSLDYFVLLDRKDLIEKRKLTHPFLNRSEKSWEQKNFRMQSPFITVICFDMIMNGVALGDRLGRIQVLGQGRGRGSGFIGFGYHLHFPPRTPTFRLTERAEGIFIVAGPRTTTMLGIWCKRERRCKKKIYWLSIWAGWLVCVTAFLRIVPKKKNPYRVRRQCFILAGPSFVNVGRSRGALQECLFFANMGLELENANFVAFNKVK